VVDELLTATTISPPGPWPANLTSVSGASRAVGPRQIAHVQMPRLRTFIELSGDALAVAVSGGLRDQKGVRGAEQVAGRRQRRGVAARDPTELIGVSVAARTVPEIGSKQSPNTTLPSTTPATRSITFGPGPSVTPPNGSGWSATSVRCAAGESSASVHSSRSPSRVETNRSEVPALKFPVGIGTARSAGGDGAIVVVLVAVFVVGRVVDVGAVPVVADVVSSVVVVGAANGFDGGLRRLVGGTEESSSVEPHPTASTIEATASAASRVLC